MEKLGQEPEAIQDADAVGRGLTCYTTVLVPRCFVVPKVQCPDVKYK